MKLKKHKAAYFFLGILFLISFFAKAQNNGCKDPNRVNNQFQCPDPSYKPVCGCDGVTYRNACSAEIHYGINPGSYTDGTCSGLEFDIIPTITNSYVTFTFSQLQTKAANADLYIIDQYGALMVFKTVYLDPSSCDGFSCKNSFPIIEVQNFKPGVYIIFLYNGRGDYRYQKMIKY
jgi:hypothetical protein